MTLLPPLYLFLSFFFLVDFAMFNDHSQKTSFLSFFFYFRVREFFLLTVSFFSLLSSPRYWARLGFHHVKAFFLRLVEHLLFFFFCPIVLITYTYYVLYF